MSENENGNPNGGGEGGDAGAWRAPLAALAGDNADYKTALESFAKPEDLFSRLTAAPAETDWRKTIAGDDAEALKGLERFTDAKSFYDSFKQKDAYINSGKKVTVPGEGASAEEIALWNAARGVPEKPDGYKITAAPPKGMEVDAATKTLLGGVTERLHAIGAEPAVVNLAHEVVYERAAAEAAQRETQLEEGPKLAQERLTKVWKTEAEFKENANWAAAGAYQFIGPKGSPELEAFSNTLVFDGERYWRAGDFPPFIEAFAKAGRASAEDTLFLEASGGGDGAASVQEQIDQIMALRSSDPKKYNAPETRERHTKLLAAKARHEQLQGKRPQAAA